MCQIIQFNSLRRHQHPKLWGPVQSLISAEMKPRRQWKATDVIVGTPVSQSTHTTHLSLGYFLKRCCRLICGAVGLHTLICHNQSGLKLSVKISHPWSRHTVAWLKQTSALTIICNLKTNDVAKLELRVGFLFFGSLCLFAVCSFLC